MQTHIFSTVTALNNALAKWIADYIDETLAKKEVFTFCLSGGNTPKALYELLAADYYTTIDWKRIHFFWGDERYVPFDDDRNNAAMATKSLLENVYVPNDNIHMMRTDLEIDRSVREYNQVLHTFFDGASTTFDMVLLGMGTDGHTLSLFPGEYDLENLQPWAIAVEKDSFKRITLTPEFANRASAIVFLIAGADKAETLQHVINGPYLPETYPSQLIKPLNNNLHFFIDEAAADYIETGEDVPGK